MTSRLAEMTTAEAADAAAGGTVVVLPVGALEQHGPAMPLATDLIRAEAIADRLAGALPGQVVIGPNIPVGVSPHHLDFAGTVTLRPATFAAVLREYVDSLASHGWRRFLVVTGHGGNNAALGTVAQDLLHDRPDIEFAWTPVTSLAGPVVADMDVSEVHGHCGEAETAQMLHVAPELVHADRLTPGTTTTEQLDPLSRLSRGAAPDLAVRYRRLSANGVLGDPTRATTEQGQAIVDHVTARIVAFLEDWLAT